jgi:hypothetical protein
LYPVFQDVIRLFVGIQLIFIINAFVNKHLIHNSYIRSIILILFPYMFFNMYYNDLSYVHLFKAYNDYFLMIPTAILISTYFSKSDIRNIVLFVFMLVKMQMVIVIIQFSYLLMTKGVGFHSDDIYGTFSDANILGYTVGMVLIVSIVFRYLNSEINNSWRLHLNKQILMCATIIMLSEARAAILTLIILAIASLILFQELRTLISRKILYIMSGLALLSITFSLAMGSGSLTNNNITRLFSISQFMEIEQNAASGAGRFLWYPITFEDLNNYSRNPAFGFGPSNHSSFGAFFLDTSINRTLVYNRFRQKDLGLDAGVDSQIIPIWAEYGYVGLFLFFGIYFKLIYSFYRKYLKTNYGFMKTVYLLGFLITAYFVILTYASQIWQSPPFTLLYYSLISIIYKYELFNRSKVQQENVLH